MAGKNQYSEQQQQLYKAFLQLENQQEVAAFLRDLLTIKEIKDLSTRLEIAKLLNQKKLSYQQIAKKCNVSTTTVTRVAQWLNHGKGGYKLILKRLFK
jgi:TrpR-related protein YerC/YecD